MVVDYAQKLRTGNRVGLHYSPFAESGCRIPQQFDGFGEPKDFFRGRIREVGLRKCGLKSTACIVSTRTANSTARDSVGFSNPSKSARSSLRQIFLAFKPRSTCAKWTQFRLKKSSPRRRIFTGCGPNSNQRRSGQSSRQLPKRSWLAKTKSTYSAVHRIGHSV